jgi:hypothetical protein
MTAFDMTAFDVTAFVMTAFCHGRAPMPLANKAFCASGIWWSPP